MKRRSLILIVLIVMLPVLILGWIWYRMVRDEQVVSQQRFRSVMEQRLEDINRTIASRFEETERTLRGITATDDLNVETLRAIVRHEPRISQLFVLSSNGNLVYPNPAEILNGTEVSFLRQASQMFIGGDLQNAVALAEAGVGEKIVQRFAIPELSASVNQSQELKQETTVAANDDLHRMDSEEQGRSESASRTESTQSLQVGNDSSQFPPPVSPPPAAVRNAPAFEEAVSADAGDSQPQALARSPRRFRGETGQRTNPPSTPGILESNSRSIFSQDPADRIAVPGGDLVQQRNTPGTNDAQQSAGLFRNSSGWFVWYWDRGLNLIYWQRRPSGYIVGAALERARWISDLISWLPETADGRRSDPAAVATSFRLSSSANELIYEWGASQRETVPPFCEIPLAAPLASWRLQCFVPADDLPTIGQRSVGLGFTAGLSAFALTLITLAWLLYRDYSRDMREASQQVTFVNQVSHELKTPLTNIRLYAELLEHDLESISAEVTERPLRRLEIITSEAQRLSRLIGNVLTFARHQRKTLQVNRVEVNPGQLVRQICERFSPSLDEHKISMKVEIVNDKVLRVDPDIVEQILGNLISNVEKYAGRGAVLAVRCECSETGLLIDVVDNGPGIPPEQRDRVFRPFARLNNDLRSSTGTGIGLSIVRELARLHGGDARLQNTEQGCWFRITLPSAPERSERQK